MNAWAAPIVFAHHVRAYDMGSSLPIVSDTRPGRTQMFWMYALEGDRVSVDASSALKDSKSLVRANQFSAR